MYRLFLENIAKHIQLTPTEEALLLEHIEYRHVLKNENIVNTGEHANEIYFVTKGCLRIYQTTEKGEDINILFCPEDWWACEIISFSQQRSSQFSIQALENTEVVVLNSATLEKLYHQIIKLERFFRILFQNGFALYQRRLMLVLSTKAELRYELFILQYPTLINRLTQKHIASYLGITPVFLSILRKRNITPKY